LEDETEYLAGVSALYDLGESEIVTYEFTYFVDSNEDDIPNPVNRLYQNTPNPFNPSTIIQFSIENTAENTAIIIYNLKGQKVKTFSSNCHPELVEGSIVWDGKDEGGNPVSSGLYFYKLQVGNKEIDSKKMILLK